VTDSDKSTVLYNIDLRNRRPNMTIRKPTNNGITDDDTNEAATGPAAATVEFHPWSRKMEVQVHGQTFRMKRKNWKCCDLQWDSPAFAGRKLTWKRKSRWAVLDFVLLDDETQAPLAMVSPNSLSCKKAGTIEILEGAGQSKIEEEAIDEIVITGLAVLQDSIYTSVAASAGA
jgi:hypothetical protein